ncbi:MAG: SDR family NAD(P)-dependent oxidoreductase [Polyangiaceae bacterium]|nr:SDR family NAD(P)-dependent oxidoreductase [Polyangiaceae bacterium]
MMKNLSLQNEWALVTGASSGLGAEMARQLAKTHKANLLLVARRQERLELLADELRQEMGVEVRTLALDLSDPESLPLLVNESAELSLKAVLLNAGVTYFGAYDQLDTEEFAQMIRLNIESTTLLMNHYALEFSQSKNQGAILVVASLAGLTPIAYQAAYSGSKAYLINYGCALAEELRPQQVSLSVFAPGGIATEMTAGAKFNELRGWLVPVGPCARRALDGMLQRRLLIVPGLFYRISTWFTRLLPLRIVTSQIARQYRSSLKKHLGSEANKKRDA